MLGYEYFIRKMDKRKDRTNETIRYIFNHGENHAHHKSYSI